MASSAFIVVSDNVIRYGSNGKSVVKHCVEFECAEDNCKQGGIGFGNNNAYVRFNAQYTYPGNMNVNDVTLVPERTNQMSITINDTERILICLDTTQKDNIFTVIKGNATRVHSFHYGIGLSSIRLVTYQGSNTATNQDMIYLYTRQNEFKNKIPDGYRGWDDGSIITCYNKFRYSFISIHYLLYTAILIKI